MEFRDLKKQYEVLKYDIDKEVIRVMSDGNFISGRQVVELEEQLADYVGVKHCITCANGTDALSLAMMAWNIGPGDAVFVPDFTFFASGEIVSLAGATPVFVDIEEDTFNISPDSLEKAIRVVLKEDKLTPKAIIAVDLFGQPADYDRIIPIAEKYGLDVLEDGAQGFGGEIRGKKACSFGKISTTSFFPAKPLGCYGDGGAVFTADDELAALLRSLRVHGKGENKYDNVRVGMNSRLDTIQAAVLKVKLKAFTDYELLAVNNIASKYSEMLSKVVKCPVVTKDYLSSWAQYSILLENEKQRDGLQKYLKEHGIPSMIYYPKPMHKQLAFQNVEQKVDLYTAENSCGRILSLSIHPYMNCEEQEIIVSTIIDYLSIG